MTKVRPLESSARNLELELLLQCLRWRLGDQRSLGDCELECDSVDWNRFLALAERHRIVPAVHEAIAAEQLRGVPAPIAETIDSRQTYIALRSLQLAAELVRLTKVFRASGIACASFKGPVLAVSVYGGFARRQFRDLDLLICPDDLRNASACLHDNGYTGVGVPVHDLPPRRMSTLARRFPEYGFVRPHASGPIVLDLHWRLSYTRQLTQQMCGRMMNGRSSVTLGDESIWTLTPTDRLAYCAYHVCRHRGARLSWLADVAHSLSSFQRGDWSHVVGETDLVLRPYLMCALVVLERLRLISGLAAAVEEMRPWRRSLSRPAGSMVQCLQGDISLARHPKRIQYLNFFCQIEGSWRPFWSIAARHLAPQATDLMNPGWWPPYLRRWGRLLARLTRRGSLTRSRQSSLRRRSSRRSAV